MSAAPDAPVADGAVDGRGGGGAVVEIAGGDVGERWTRTAAVTRRCHHTPRPHHRAAATAALTH